MRCARFGTWSVTAAAVAAVLTGAAACGGGSGGGGGGTGGNAALTYWASTEGTGAQQSQQTIGRVVSKFTKETGIKVNFQIIPWTDLETKILTAVTSGSGPDVVDIGNTWAPSFAATGGFVPFTKANLSKVGGAGKFVQASFNTTGLPGKTPMSVPLYAEAYALQYNKAEFARAGISGPPATWSQLVADGKKLTHGGQWGIAIEGGSYTEASHWAFILGRQYGNPLYVNGRPHFATPAELTAVKQYVDLIGADHIADPADAEYTSNQSVTAFAQGKAAMLIWQNPATSLGQLGMKPSAYGIAPMPMPATTPPGGQPVQSHTAGENLAIMKSTTHLQEALKFVRYMTSEPVQVELARTYGLLPVVKAAYANPALQTPAYQTYRNILEQHSVPMPRVASESQMETSLGGAIVNLIRTAATTGHVSDQQIMSALQSAQQKVAAAGAGG